MAAPTVETRTSDARMMIGYQLLIAIPPDTSFVTILNLQLKNFIAQWSSISYQDIIPINSIIALVTENPTIP
jgi:hypothetical protein